ncbi:MAG TPA: DUF1127 domain-containing protein [Dongiaceae bacterium]|jgi:uncharacterized protein YjiS (DUF1127 family)|nr:DUF1127 domain-containing protein [Dongiaceae bacterium]
MERDYWMINALDLILVWVDRSRQRAQLAGIDGSLLKDVGLSPGEIDAECRKHFWQR